MDRNIQESLTDTAIGRGMTIREHWNGGYHRKIGKSPDSMKVLRIDRGDITSVRPVCAHPMHPQFFEIPFDFSSAFERFGPILF
jgi:hypothetical protein